MASEPDVEIAARVRADEVRFECRPEVRVRAYAGSPATAELVSERDNLPDEVEPGVTYTDVAIPWRLAARLADQPEPDAEAPSPTGHDTPVPPSPQ
jgi:hypothetical protein